MTVGPPIPSGECDELWEDKGEEGDRVTKTLFDGAQVKEQSVKFNDKR